ncbi:SHOCT domain-containing protein [Halobacillus sp. A5]|uniref:SHOCT domain-containing protein n=1 Tax=Halobacillus sp. A5 TaxID=2880263 RepID=UPI0020A64D92|nr:SHOCT domain-containing protein [Halobacillus sp. A5]MCP3027086.1 SHOCT domain-containing protein [Halobacillus sp. A5]
MAPRYSIKPNKVFAIIGAIVGILFLIVGGQVVSEVGSFGVIWMLIAVGLTIFFLINIFSSKGAAPYELEARNEENHNSSNFEDFETEVRRLHRLREEGLLSEEEYQKKKKKLIN